MAGALISKRNHSKVVFEAHRPLVSAIPNSTFWRIPRELLTKCPGSSKAHHLIVEESATSEEGTPGTSEALQTLSSPQDTHLLLDKTAVSYGSWEDWGPSW